MRRWRRGQEEDDETIVFDDNGEAEDRHRPRSYARPLRTIFGNDDDDEEEEDAPSFDDLEPEIRAGKYKPKPSDPWNAHILYQSLRDLGEI